MIPEQNDEYGQSPEGKFLRSLLIHALFQFVPDQHALVVEKDGQKYDLVRDGDDLRFFECKYDTPAGTIVPVEWSEEILH